MLFKRMLPIPVFYGMRYPITLNCAACSHKFTWQQFRLTHPNTTFTLIEQSHNIHCIATYMQCLKTKQTSILKFSKFKDEVGINKSTETRNDGITAKLSEKIPTLAC